MASTADLDLRRHWLFEGLSAKEERALRRVGSLRELPARAVLYEEGGPGDEMALVLEGTAAIRRNGRLLARVGPGDTVGELAVLDGEPRSASVVALTDLRLLTFPRRAVRDLLDQEPGLAGKLLTALARRLRDADRRAYG
ncbi:cyclic nucleotide-binding domain-containing protein [Aciditerrimonas ferrireducens]|uniref:cyclic nucleotide-binding domain-containing protein n=1 Tax=Aciditerrimonas ferrireducens TaxID=667306 RepID=UPI002005296F|nr:cyclic nucleotide-binding domain-containing protein [Aciditerrimonas ferrireducens]MCK4177581.1 cyclic nucleotide-binding domain-containing protein [Aciditerrimonas ferrireducens]